MRRRGKAALVAAAAVIAAMVIAACGGDDFDNDPRPPIALEVGVQVGDGGVTVSPREFGAGIANFTIVNFGELPTAVEIDGPSQGLSPEIAPGTSNVLKMELEPGDYEAIAVALDDEATFPFTVGPERESASGDLLLP
jgi:hypothetical protein